MYFFVDKDVYFCVFSCKDVLHGLSYQVVQRWMFICCLYGNLFTFFFFDFRESSSSHIRQQTDPRNSTERQ